MTRTNEQLACLPVAYGTALGMLERAEVSDGETMLVTGASGGVGLPRVQPTAARGANVVAVSSTEKADRGRDAGAMAVVSRHTGDLAGPVTNLVPSGLELPPTSWGPGIEALMPLVRDGSHWVIARTVAGPVVSFDLRRLYLRNLRLIGSSMHTRVHFAKLVDIA